MVMENLNLKKRVASNLVNVGKVSIKKKKSDICHNYTRGVICANFSQFKKRMVTNVWMIMNKNLETRRKISDKSKVGKYSN